MPRLLEAVVVATIQIALVVLIGLIHDNLRMKLKVWSLAFWILVSMSAVLYIWRGI